MLNNSFDSLCGDYTANNDMIKDFANRCPQLKSQINETVCNLRKRILSCKHRLTRAHREKQLKMSCQALHNAPPNRT